MGGRRWVALFVGAGLFAGSTSGGIDGPVLTSQWTLTGGGMDAILSGTVVLDRGCLYLDNEGSRVPVIWPSGTRWQADPPAVILGDTAVPMGESVTGGGGWVPADALSSASQVPVEVAEAAAACLTGTDEIAMFNPGSDVSPVGPTEDPAT